MYSDAAFITLVTEASIFTGKTLWVLGSDCTMNLHWVQDWAQNTEAGLGVPVVADFMTYSSVYTFKHCREHFLKPFKQAALRKPSIRSTTREPGKCHLFV